MPPFSSWQVNGVAKNAIINGDMRIAQRGTSFAPATTNAYTLDRWFYSTSGAVHTITQSTDVPEDQFQSSLKLDCTTADTSIAAGDLVILQHRIEGYNFRRFVGKTATLSFWIKAGKADSTMCVSFRSSPGDRSYITEHVIESANTWERKSVTLDFDYVGGTWNYTNGNGLFLDFVLLAGSTYQSTAGSWLSTNDLATSNQTNFCDATDSTCDVYITGVQLELGGKATDFEFLRYEQQLIACQRYYEVIGQDATDASSVRIRGYHLSGYNLIGTIPFAVKKRATPTVALAGSWTTNGTVSLQCYCPTNLMIAVVRTLTGAGDVYAWPANASSNITADAEL